MISNRLRDPLWNLEQFEEISHAKSSIWFEMRNGVNKFLFRGFPVDWATLFAIWSSLKKFYEQNLHYGLKRKKEGTSFFSGNFQSIGPPIFHLEEFGEIFFAKSSMWFEMRKGVKNFLFRGFQVDWVFF